MINIYIALCITVLAATIHTLPPIDGSDNESDQNTMDDYKDYYLVMNIDYSSDQQFEEENHQTSRHLKYVIDGAIQRIKSAGITYRQRLQEDQCVVEYDGQFLTENSVTQIRKKLYRVEDCLLERVFHACGPNLLLMLNVVCRVVEQQHRTTTPVPVRRQTTPPIPAFLHRLYPRASKTPRVITESCCENLCTISELTRYCHR